MTKTRIYLITIALFLLTACNKQVQNQTPDTQPSTEKSQNSEETTEAHTNIQTVDSVAYVNKLKALANGDTTGKWPTAIHQLPSDGRAILPFNRIIAYYGNLYSKKMGILGEVPPKELWVKLNKELAAWRKADPNTPVIPAIHYIASVSQGSPQKDGKYRLRMPSHQIDSALAVAKMGNAIVFLDIQVALSNVQAEVPVLEKYLKMPHVHLGIDPEFSMKDGSLPGKRIGTMNEEDINFCSDYLAKLVKANNLPPKVLVVHRFTQGMVRNYKNIKLHPEVQIVMNMDGWGEPVLKRSTYKLYIYKEPVQFTGFKLFYKNDLKKDPHVMLTPEDLLKLKPQPIYIQYQ